MRKPLRVVIVLSAVALVAIMLAVPWYSSTASAIDNTQTRAPVIYSVGGQDQMKTRNWLPSIANDVWTSDVLGRVYDSVGQTDPVTDELKPYILKGVDVNGDENFSRAEKGFFLKGPCIPTPCADEVSWRRTIVAYYDFSGVYYQDGIQATIGDVLFNYVMQSLNPRFNTDMRVLWDDPNAATFPASRHLNIDLLWCGPTNVQWQGAPTAPGTNSLRCALRFRLQDDFALFYRSTLAGLTLFPRHEFELTGGGRHTVINDPAVPECTDTDWGRAIYPETDSRFGQGIRTDETSYRPFRYQCAERWPMTDADVIGTGPFRFGTWSPGAFERVDKYTNYFYGVDPNQPSVVLDPDLLSYIHQPFIDSILYRIYKTTTLGVLALQSGEIDFYHWALPPEFVPDLLNDQHVQVWANAEPGFFYMAYNMRRQPFGYQTYPPTPSNDRSSDTGLLFRQAFAHLIDKATIVRVLLQNYGVIADGTVSPSNTFWYNGTLPKYAYSPSVAATLFDNMGATIGPNGWRVFNRLGDTQFEILTPQADYDPIRASAGAMIAAAARSIGVNVISKPTAFGSIVSAITAADFDIFILGWRISGTDPDYLFSFFHSSNANGGQNYPGFYDSQFDQVVSSSRKELDEGKRQQLIKWGEGILAQRLPYDVLYYRTNIEAERKDRFVNYSVSSGTIWNYWSIQSIQRPSNLFIHAVPSYPSAIVEGGTALVTVTVRNQDGTAVSGGTVTLSVASGNGVFTGGPGPCPGTNTCTGTTGAGGTLTVTYNAPAAVPANPDVTVQVTAQAAGYPIDTRTVVVTVFATGTSFLSVTPKLNAGDLVPTSEPLTFGVEVRDQDGLLASGAQVALTVSPSGPILTPASGSASTMASGVVFQAPATIPQSPAVYHVSVTATQAGFQQGAGGFDVTVVRLSNKFTCPDGTQVDVGQPCPRVSIPALDALPILATIGVAAVVYGIIRSRKKGA